MLFICYNIYVRLGNQQIKKVSKSVDTLEMLCYNSIVRSGNQQLKKKLKNF